MTTKRHHHRSNVDSTANTATQISPKDVKVATNTPVATSLKVLFAHVTWFFIGPMALFLTLLCIVRSGTGWTTGLDIEFFVFVGLSVWCRWYDQRSGQATNYDGEASTWADCRRYMCWMPVAAGVAWIVANVVGNHF
jgi:hypothetical protein